MFTSCCPAWVKYLENEDPKYLKNISTCKSPMEMFAAILRDQVRRKDDRTAGRPTISPSCPARPRRWRPGARNSRTTASPDVDLVLTTQRGHPA